MDFINKLTVDKEIAYKMLYSNEKIPVHIKCYNGFQNKDIRKFVEIVYKNFEEYNKYPELNHHRKNITKILKYPKSIVILALNDNKIIAYLIASNISNNIMHVFYLFVTPVRRKSSIATYMLNIIQEKTFYESLNILSISVDTYNKENEKFFIDNNFNYDDNYRTYNRYDFMIKHV